MTSFAVKNELNVDHDGVPLTVVYDGFSDGDSRVIAVKIKDCYITDIASSDLIDWLETEVNERWKELLEDLEYDE